MSERSRLILAANAKPGVGGQGLNLQHMIEGLEPHFDLTVLCASTVPGDSRFKAIAPSKLARAIQRLPYLRRQRGWTTYFAERAFDLAVARQLGSLGPADFFQGITGQCLSSLRRARQLGCATAVDVVTVHPGLFADETARACREFGVTSPIHPWLKRRMLAEIAETDLIRVMSRTAQATFVERGDSPDRVVVATPPLDVAQFTPASFAGPDFRISFVGLLEPWKGAQYLLEAYARLQGRRAVLALWGGSGSRRMTQCIESARAKSGPIEMDPRPVRQIGLDRVYGDSSVLVHPSLSEGFGYVVGEAMAAGLPVIIGPHVGARDLVRESENGFVIDPRRVDSIVDCLTVLLEHPARLQEMGANARRAAAQLTRQAFMAEYPEKLRQLRRPSPNRQNRK